MKTFGTIKNKILNKMITHFVSNNKEELKTLLNVIMENKDLKELYLLYEDIENKNFEDPDSGKMYIDELSKMLNSKHKQLKPILETINKNLSDIDCEKNEIYDMLDILSEDDNLLNIDKKVKTKKNLLEFLLKNKHNKKEEPVTIFTENEKLLTAVLTNNFNNYYSNTLDEEQKRELKDLLSLNNDDVKIKIEELKTSTLVKLEEIINENKINDNELIKKLNETKHEIEKIEHTKIGLYRLKELKNALK